MTSIEVTVDEDAGYDGYCVFHPGNFCAVAVRITLQLVSRPRELPVVQGLIVLLLLQATRRGWCGGERASVPEDGRPAHLYRDEQGLPLEFWGMGGRPMVRGVKTRRGICLRSLAARDSSRRLVANPEVESSFYHDIGHW